MTTETGWQMFIVATWVVAVLALLWALVIGAMFWREARVWFEAEAREPVPVPPLRLVSSSRPASKGLAPETCEQRRRQRGLVHS